METNFKDYQFPALKRELDYLTENIEQSFSFSLETQISNLLAFKRDLENSREELGIPLKGFHTAQEVLEWVEALNAADQKRFSDIVNNYLTNLQLGLNWYMVMGYTLLSANPLCPERMVPPRQEYYLKTD